jgi:hypothetical protein
MLASEITNRRNAVRIYVALTRAEAARLSALAERERRQPKDQAAYLLVRALDSEADHEQHAERADHSTGVAS